MAIRIDGLQAELLKKRGRSYDTVGLASDKKRMDNRRTPRRLENFSHLSNTQQMGDKRDRNNYRGIALLSVECSLLKLYPN